MSRHVKADSFAALVRQFIASEKFKKYAETTKDTWGRELAFMVRPGVLGELPIDRLKPSLIQEYLDGWSDRPGKQANALAVLKQLEKWAVVRDLIPRQITLGVETGRPRGGHTPWSETQVECARNHAKSEIARAVTLGAFTGQRGSDLVRIGWSHLETFQGRQGITLTQQKTGREVWIPILEPLARAMETWEKQPGPFLRKADDRPWTRKHLTKAWLYERDHNLALQPLREAGLVLHGLRGHACVRLYRAGCTTRQVADMVGMSEPMVGRYTRKSVQRENATAAVIQLERSQAIDIKDKDILLQYNRNSGND